jgi:hypothetical protein
MINNPIYPKPEIKVLDDDKLESYYITSKRSNAVLNFEFDFCDNNELNDIVENGLSIAVH